jgi:hypothetical protein
MASSVTRSYVDGQLAGMVARTDDRDTVRHTPAHLAKRFAESRNPRGLIGGIDRERAQADRAYWLGYLRALRSDDGV